MQEFIIHATHRQTSQSQNDNAYCDFSVPLFIGALKYLVFKVEFLVPELNGIYFVLPSVGNRYSHQAVALSEMDVLRFSERIDVRDTNHA